MLQRLSKAMLIASICCTSLCFSADAWCSMTAEEHYKQGVVLLNEVRDAKGALEHFNEALSLGEKEIEWLRDPQHYPEGHSFRHRHCLKKYYKHYHKGLVQAQKRKEYSGPKKSIFNRTVDDREHDQYVIASDWFARSAFTAELYFYRGRAKLAAGGANEEINGAIGDFDEIINNQERYAAWFAIQNNFFELYYYSGRALVLTGDFDSAQSCLEEVVGIEVKQHIIWLATPANRAELYYLYGKAMQNTGEHDEYAARYFEILLARQEEFADWFRESGHSVAELYFEIATVLCNREEFADAREYLDKIQKQQAQWLKFPDNQRKFNRLCLSAVEETSVDSVEEIPVEFAGRFQAL